MSILCKLALISLFVATNCRNAWEVESSSQDLQRDLEEKEAIRAKTSIIAYDKARMSEENINLEDTRIKTKCRDLSCPCTTTKLAAIGVFLITWHCDKQYVCFSVRN